jgi:MFS family permease
MLAATLENNALKKEHARAKNRYVALFILCFLSNAFGGTISTLMSVYLPVAVKELLGNRTVNELATISAYINAIFILGWAAGGFIWGFISDRIGRKKAFLFATACYGVATVCTGLMQGWQGVVACRALSGFGMGGVLVISFTYFSEVWPQKTRAIFTGILSISIPVGIFSAGVINYIVANWRQGFFVGVLPVLLSIVGIWCLQESGSWKASKEEPTPSQPRVKNSVLAGGYQKQLWMGSIVFGTMLIGLWAIFSWLPTWVQSLTTSGDAQKERGISMMLLGMGGLLGGFVSGWFMKVVNEKKALAICFIVSAVFSFLLFKTNIVFNALVYAELAVLALFFGISQGVLSVYIPELFPTHIRATATGICFNTGRIVTALAVLSVGVLVTTLGGYGNALFIFSLVFVVGLLALLLMGQQPAASDATFSKPHAGTWSDVQASNANSFNN